MQQRAKEGKGPFRKRAENEPVACTAWATQRAEHANYHAQGRQTPAADMRTSTARMAELKEQ